MKTLFIELFLLLFLITVLNAQGDKHTGIAFEHDLSWRKLLEKAKAENKYIFVDCLTTWCGPCKLMEKDVYPKEEIGKYFNDHFISVKLQMDKTEIDNQRVKNWYANSEMSQTKYGVRVYPTYFFFSAQGKLTNRDKGYKNAIDFLVVSKKAIESTIQAPYHKYYQILSEYERRKKDYTTMPALMDTVKLLGQAGQEENIVSDYKNHLLILSDNELYSRERILFLSAHLQSSYDPLFHVLF